MKHYEAEVLQYRHANHIKVKYLNTETKYEEYLLTFSLCIILIVT